MKGRIAIVAIVAISALAVPALATPLHVWYMNEGTGTTVSDSGISSTLVTLTASSGTDPIWANDAPPSDLAPSAASNSMSYNGAGYLSASGDFESMAWDYTIEMWIKPSTFDGYHVLFNTNFTSTGQLVFRANGYDLQMDCGWWNSNERVISNFFTETDVNQWIHIAFVYDGIAGEYATSGATMSVYKNGTLVESLDSANYPGVFTTISLSNSNGFWQFDGNIGAVSWDNTLASPGNFSLLVPEPTSLAFIFVGGITMLYRRHRHKC